MPNLRGTAPPNRRRRRPRRATRPPTRRSDGTSRAGAGAARSSSSAMAGPEGGAEHRDLAAELEALTVRVKDAERYLGLDEFRARRTELEAAVNDPKLWDDQDRARALTKELGQVGGDVDRFDALEAD